MAWRGRRRLAAWLSAGWAHSCRPSYRNGLCAGAPASDCCRCLRRWAAEADVGGRAGAPAETGNHGLCFRQKGRIGGVDLEDGVVGHAELTAREPDLPAGHRAIGRLLHRVGADRRVGCRIPEAHWRWAAATPVDPNDNATGRDGNRVDTAQHRAIRLRLICPVVPRTRPEYGQHVDAVSYTHLRA